MLTVMALSVGLGEEEEATMAAVDEEAVLGLHATLVREAKAPVAAEASLAEDGRPRMHGICIAGNLWPGCADTTPDKPRR